jgi:hypothetical protein
MLGWVEILYFIIYENACSRSKYLEKFRSLSQIQGKTSESNIFPMALINLSPIDKIGSYHEALKSVCTVLKSTA